MGVDRRDGGARHAVLRHHQPRPWPVVPQRQVAHPFGLRISVHVAFCVLLSRPRLRSKGPHAGRYPSTGRHGVDDVRAVLRRLGGARPLPPPGLGENGRMRGRIPVRPAGHDPSATGQETAMTVETLEDMGELAQQLRVDSIRCSTAAGSGHPTSSMSAADVMAVLLARYFRYDWEQPDNPANDHLIFSKGHASPLLYSMFKAAGVVSDDELMNTVPAVRLTAGGPPDPGAAVGRRRHRIARPGTARRGRGGPGRPVSRRAAVPGVGAVRRQRDGRRLDVGGVRQGGLLPAGQPDRDRRREPPRPARPDRAGLGSGGIYQTDRGVRLSCHPHRRARPRGDRQGARLRGRRGPAHGDPRPDP